MTTVTRTIDVDVPLSAAYDRWTRMEEYPDFMLDVDNVHQVSDERTHWTMNVAGVKREFDAVITEQVPDRIIAWHSEGELDQGGRVEFEPVSDHTTRVTLSLEWEPSGMVERVGSALQVDSGVVESDLENFKSLVEREGDQGGWRGEIHETDVAPTHMEGNTPSEQTRPQTFPE